MRCKPSCWRVFVYYGEYVKKYQIVVRNSDGVHCEALDRLSAGGQQAWAVAFAAWVATCQMGGYVPECSVHHGGDVQE